MTTHNTASHWLERCAVQDEHWNQSFWPAQMAQVDFDTDQEDDDNEVEYQHERQRPTKMQDAFKSVHSTPDMASSSSKRPSLSRSTSLHQISSECTTSTPVNHRGRHTRASSGPEPATNKLQIDTFLPLQLPPTDLCTLSPLNTYPTTWWTPSEDSLRRTDSFISASSDGSWHGDHGDDDIDGQLERAINQASTTSISSLGKKKTNDGLIISTYDYEDECTHLSDEVQVRVQDDIDDDKEEKEIRAHAGPLMNEVASFFLDLKALTLSDYYQSDEASNSGPSSLQQRVLNRSQSDHLLASRTSSTHDLAMESNMLQNHRRQRAATIPTRSARALEKSPALKSSRMQSIWQWFLPTIDDTFERELLGCPRHHHGTQFRRHDSIPSLYSDSSDTEREESEDEDGEDSSPFTSSSLRDSQMVDLEGISGKRASVSKSYYRRSFVDSGGAPSPLWDNRWEEEPYQRPWSSVLNLPALS